MHRPILFAIATLALSTAALAQSDTCCEPPADQPAKACCQPAQAQPAPKACCQKPEAAAARPAIGKSVKNFALLDSNAKPFRIVETGEPQITVLTFWCSICGSCRIVEHAFDAKREQYRTKGVRYIMVASNEDETAAGVNEFLAENKLGFRVLMDTRSTLARYFGATLTTTTAVIDARGRLRYFGSLAKSEDAVRSLLAGQEVAVPETTPDGCDIMLAPPPAEPAGRTPPAPPTR